MKLVFNNISKIHKRKQQTYNLRDVSYSFTESRNVAVLSTHERSAVAFINLISGIEQPTRGSITRQGLFTGSIGNATFFHRELTGEENIRFICKLYGQDANKTITEVRAFAGLNNDLKQKTKTYNPLTKRKIAISTSLFIKSDVYQITTPLNHPHKSFSENVDRKLVELSSQATLVLSTTDKNILEKHAQCSIVLDSQGKLSQFDDLTSGINAQTAQKQVP